MEYLKKYPTEPLILEPEDYPNEEWKVICKLFGLEQAERVRINVSTLEAWGTPKRVITKEQWETAIKHLDAFILQYSRTRGYIWSGSCINPSILKKRYEDGERTVELYDAMMGVNT